jgi:predicted O-methyltransferase YrrM
MSGDLDTETRRARRRRRRRRLRRRVLRVLSIPVHRRDALRRVEALHAQPRSLEELVDAALDLGSRGLLKVRASQRRGELLALAREVAGLAPRNVVEVGTHLGGTLLLWSHLATRRVVTVDLVQPGFRRSLLRRFAPPGSRCEVVSIAGDSHDPAVRGRVEAALGGEPADFLFLDGDHAEAGVEADWRDYAPLVRPGGLVALHDIVAAQPDPATQVAAFWRRLRDERGGEELVEDADQCGYGIGLVRVAARVTTSGA